jgi:uncharacterized protein
MPCDVDEPPIVDEDLECNSRIKGSLSFTNTGSALLLDGNVETSVVLPCSRCLVYFEEPVKLEISEQFPMEANPSPHGRGTHIIVEEDENPDAGKLFDGPHLDLTELLRQNITLSLPVKPLHDESCRGLCPVCGKDRNERDCGCEERTVNPAFAKLAALLTDDDKR